MLLCGWRSAKNNRYEKIINVTYYSNKAGIEVSVSNRQKSMKFLLPGRDIEDGKRLANAILNGKTNVHIKKLDKGAVH